MIALPLVASLAFVPMQNQAPPSLEGTFTVAPSSAPQEPAPPTTAAPTPAPQSRTITLEGPSSISITVEEPDDEPGEVGTFSVISFGPAPQMPAPLPAALQPPPPPPPPAPVVIQAPPVSYLQFVLGTAAGLPCLWVEPPLYAPRVSMEALEVHPVPTLPLYPR